VKSADAPVPARGVICMLSALILHLALHSLFDIHKILETIHKIKTHMEQDSIRKF